MFLFIEFLKYSGLVLLPVVEVLKSDSMKQMFLIIGALFCLSLGLSSCAVEATTYPYYDEPQVRGGIYYESRPRYYYNRRYYHHRYYTPRGYYYAPRGYHYRYH